MTLFGEYDKRHRNFWAGMLEAEFNPPELALLIGHLCWNNREMSRRIGKVLLTSLNKIAMRALATSLEVV